jgi:hypothetical protein
VLAVDAQWAGEPDWDLCDAGEVLDVAGQDGGIKRELAHVVEPDACLVV